MHDSNNRQSAVVVARQTPLSWMTEKGVVKLRPKGLKIVMLCLWADSIISLGYLQPDQWDSTGKIVSFLLTKVLWFWTYWYLWRGRNWARILTVISAGMVFFIPFFIPIHTPVMQAYTVAFSVFSAFMIYYLSTKPLVRFFKAPGNGASNPPQGC
jgi:hypothetical protein